MAQDIVSKTEVAARAAFFSMVTWGALSLSPAAVSQDNQASPPSTTPAQSTPAPSASAPENETLEEVVVTGFRRSLEVALEIKREATGVVDSIVAEDIAKFPDNNLAESIQRIPGVAITRDGGEGKNISVRGLGPDFTRVRINGMEAQAITDGITAINRGRNFDFNVFASELFSRIDVHKTAAADLDEGSLGATVDLYTARPFDYSGFKTAGSLKAGYSELSGEVDPRAALLISNTWGDKKFGALASVAYSENNRVLNGSNSGNWDVGTSNGGFCNPSLPRCAGSNAAAFSVANGVTSWHPRFLRYWEDTLDQKRLGVTGTLQWAPTDNTLVNFDTLYSHFEGVHTQPTMEPIAFSRPASQGGKPEIVIRDAQVDAAGSLVYGVFDNVDIRSEDIYDAFETDFLQMTLSANHEFTDRFSVNALAGSARSDQDNDKDLVVQMDRFNVDGFTYDMRNGAKTPAINWGFDVTDPNAWYFGRLVTQPGGTGATGPEIRLRPNRTDNTYDVGQVAAKYNFGGALNFTLNGGVQAKKYTFRQSGERLVRGEPDMPNLPAGVTNADLTRMFCGLERLDVPDGTPRCWLIPNALAIADAYGVFNAPPGSRYEVSGTITGARGDNRFVEEKDNGAFLQAVIDTELFGRTLKGDLGLRYVKTKQESQFLAGTSTSASLTTINREYSDTLPSLNLSYEVVDDLLLRFGAAKVMARPGLGGLAAATTVNVAGGARSVNTGNPFTDPYRAKDYDLSVEWYFAPRSVASVGVFYKDISTYIQNVTTVAPFSTTGLPASLLDNTGVTVNDTFTISNIINTPGGPLKGIEVGYQQPFEFLPAPFNGFGMLLNYTYVDAEIAYFATANGTVTSKNSLLNLSKNAYNATLYYGKGPFEARTSFTYRDFYLTAVPGSGNAPTNNPPISVDANGVPETKYLDFSASYKFTDHFTASLEAINLTDEFETVFQDTDVQRYQTDRHAGRQYYLGFRFNY
jgi:iron complex outermembrane recepter protein